MLKKLKEQLIFPLAFLFIYSLPACVSKENKREKRDVEKIRFEDQEAAKSKINNIKKIFYALPSPIELTFLFKEEGVAYQKEKLHDPKAKDSYSLPFKKALNLGVYGADLSYAGLFGRHQDAIEYFATTQLLAEELGVGKTFQKEFISRIEQNADDKDTLLQVVSDFFLDNESYLKDLNQQDISTFIVLGGWIEGLYLGVEMAKDFQAEGIKTIIKNQAQSLDNLILLLQQLNESTNHKKLIQSIYDLKPLFEDLVEASPEIEAEAFEQITQKVSKIRETIIN